jgi:hypothetical protein
VFANLFGGFVVLFAVFAEDFQESKPPGFWTWTISRLTLL